MPEASQWAASGGSYSRNAPNSPQPDGPSINATSRTVMPRKRTRIGNETTCRRSSRSSSDGAHQIARSRFSQYGLRRSRLSSLPVGLRGSSSKISTSRGHL